MKLPVPVAGIVAGTLVLGGLAVAGAAVGRDDGPRLPAAQVASSSSHDTSSSTSTPGGVDISGPCDEAEHADDPRCAGTPAPGSPTGGGGPDDGSGTPAPGTPAAPAGETRSFAAADAGVVTYAVDASGFRLVAATPAAGWSVEVERSAGHELDLDFRWETVRVQVDVELEDGQIRERVRVRDDATDARSESESFVDAPAPTAPASTPTTVDDHGGDVDRDDRVEAGDDSD